MSASLCVLTCPAYVSPCRLGVWVWGMAEHGPFQLSVCLVSLPPCCSRAWAEPRWILAQLTRGFDSSLFRPGLGHSSLPFTSPLRTPFTTPAPCFRRCPRESSGQQGLAWNPWPALAAATAWWAPPPPSLDLYVPSVCSLARSPHPCPALPYPPPSWLTAPCLSSSSSGSESHRLVFCLWVTPRSAENRVGQPQRVIGQMRVFPSFH